MLGPAAGFRVRAGCTSTRPMTASLTTRMPLWHGVRDYGDVPPVKGVIFTEAKEVQDGSLGRHGGDASDYELGRHTSPPQTAPPAPDQDHPGGVFQKSRKNARVVGGSSEYSGACSAVIIWSGPRGRWTPPAVRCMTTGKWVIVRAFHCEVCSAELFSRTPSA